MKLLEHWQLVLKSLLKLGRLYVGLQKKKKKQFYFLYIQNTRAVIHSSMPVNQTLIHTHTHTYETKKTLSLNTLFFINEKEKFLTVSRK